MNKEQSYQIPVLRRDCRHLHIESMSKIASILWKSKICAKNKIIVDGVAPCRRKFILEWFHYFQLPFSATNNRSFTDRYNIMTKSSIILWICDQQYEVPSFNYDLLIHCVTAPVQSCQLFLEYCVKYSMVTSLENDARFSRKEAVRISKQPGPPPPDCTQLTMTIIKPSRCSVILTQSLGSLGTWLSPLVYPTKIVFRYMISL